MAHIANDFTGATDGASDGATVSDPENTTSSEWSVFHEGCLHLKLEEAWHRRPSHDSRKGFYRKMVPVSVNFYLGRPRRLEIRWTVSVLDMSVRKWIKVRAKKNGGTDGLHFVHKKTFLDTAL